ncbi:MAG: hypothetical protein IPM54_24135 [Polyangiaceae bacterium]|nr:hypothetical protein [Polyangiaceae bacterium]
MHPRQTIIEQDKPARRLLLGITMAAGLLLTGCPTVGSLKEARPPTAEKWFQRAREDYRSADIEDARDSVKRALAIVPNDKEVRTLAARIALAELDYAETLRLLKGIKGSTASGLRGRAYWYNGDLDAAADELDKLLEDPDVVDDWAKNITKLARQGAGRTPFALSGALLATTELPHVNPYAPFFIVPVEIDGESALAMVATDSAEVALDNKTRSEPSWISIRFGGKLEVRDVPALTQDLSGISKQLGAPIKALLGVNLLRHLHATLDYEGQQFVARTFSPPQPPEATRVNLSYIRGGGMILRGKFGGDKGEPVSLLLNTSMNFPLALDEAGWKKAGLATKDLRLVPEDPDQKLRVGVVSLVRIGAFDVPRVEGVFGTPIEQVEKQISLDIDGIMGTGLLAPFRITFGDQGRMMWMEDTSLTVARMLAASASRQPGAEDELPEGLPGMPDPLNPLGPGLPGMDPTMRTPLPPGPTPGVPPAPGGAPTPAPPGGAKPQRNAPEQ